MQQNNPNPFPTSQFPSGVADGEAYLPANAAANSVRHRAPQPANLPFQSEGVQRTHTQSQFAGFPLIIPSTTAIQISLSHLLSMSHPLLEGLGRTISHHNFNRPTPINTASQCSKIHTLTSLFHNQLLYP